MAIDPAFNANTYVGKWHEIYRDDGTFFEWFADCVTATYTRNSDGTVGVWNSQYYVYL